MCPGKALSALLSDANGVILGMAPKSRMPLRALLEALNCAGWELGVRSPRGQDQATS